MWRISGKKTPEDGAAGLPKRGRWMRWYIDTEREGGVTEEDGEQKVKWRKMVSCDDSVRAAIGKKIFLFLST